MTPDIFISYSSRDALTATALCKALEEAGHSCWIAPRNILSGQTWSEAIIDGINACQIMILLYSAASNASPQVLREIERAVSKRLGLLAFRVEDVPLSKAMEYLISVSHWHDATSGPLEAHLAILVQSVQALLAARGAGCELALPRVAAVPIAPPPPALPAHNLPVPLTSFVGRVREMAEVRDRLASARLLTLLGAGGSGKTRLALQCASENLPDYPDGAWLVELAALSDPGLLAQTVASVLQVKEQPGQSLMQSLVEALSKRKALLVLDNCEHLLEACSGLATGLLRSCPHLKLLATSRSDLNVGGESVYRVPALSLPEGGKPSSVEDLGGFEAVKLFVVDLAALTKPAFTLTEGNAASVVAICRRLDGLPLALELAAARVRAMSVEQIASRLDDRFKLLTSGDRGTLPHQQTLRTLMDWSYTLLSDVEKRLLGRLSVFAGGWTLEASEQIAQPPKLFGDPSPKLFGDPSPKLFGDPGLEGGIEAWEVLDLLFSLVDKSLVVYEEQGETARYRLLETVREYAGEKLREAGELEGVRGRHRDWFLALAEEAAPKLTGADQGEWLQRLEEEHENLRSGLDWSLSVAGSSEGLRFCGALARFWWMRGYSSEGREWCARALSKGGGQERTSERTHALNGAGILAKMQGDFASARAFHEESLAIGREIGDRNGIAYSLNNLGNVASMQSDYAASRAYHEESLAIQREIGNRQGIADSLNNLGIVAYYQGDYASAWTYHEESLAIRRVMGDKRGIAASLHNLGIVAESHGDFASAWTYLKESLGIFREIGDRGGIVTSLDALGGVTSAQGDYASAWTYLEESLDIAREIGDREGIASSLNALGNVADAQGDYATALAYQEESLVIFREIGDRSGIAYALYYLGVTAGHQDDYAASRTYLKESLAILWEIGDRSGFASSLEAFAGHAGNTGKPEYAAMLWAAAEALREEIGSSLPPNERERYDREVATTRQALGEEAFSAAWASGRAMALEEAIAFALEEPV